MTTARFSSFRDRASRARLLVVGDVMLDRYWFGDVERISPEAPVPIVKIARTEERPGGAANVARNAVALGATATLLSVIGDDEPGTTLERLLVEERVRTSFHREASLRHHRQAARDRSPAAAVAHRLRDGAVARDTRHQARRLRTPARRGRPRDPLRLRQGRPRAHRDDDRARARRGQGGAGRSQGRGLRALSRRHDPDAQPGRVPPGRRALEGRGGNDRQGAGAAPRTRARPRCWSRGRRRG